YCTHESATDSRHASAHAPFRTGWRLLGDSRLARMDESSRRVQWPAASVTPQHAADIASKSNRKKPALETPCSRSLCSYSYGYTNAPQCLRHSGERRFYPSRRPDLTCPGLGAVAFL